MRRAARHPVDYPVIVEHLEHGDLKLHVSNLSAHGFMVDDAYHLARGDRIIIRLPLVGRIEAYLIWTRGNRAGFQFERSSGSTISSPSSTSFSPTLACAVRAERKFAQAQMTTLQVSPAWQGRLSLPWPQCDRT